MIRTFLLFVLFGSGLWAKPTVCLNMIVKNEAHVIERCLETVLPLIDTWVIVDTGSTDGTQEVIRDYLKDLPGQLVERPWKHFAFNRSEALWFAKGWGDYLLFIDADEWLEFDDDFKLPELTHDAYMMNFSYRGVTYQKPQLIRASLPWRWESVLHNYLKLDTPYSQGSLEKVTYLTGFDGGSHSDPEKYVKHAKLLEELLEDEPANTRYVFYLGQSYRDAGNKDKAIENYAKRAAMGGWEEEVFYSLLQVALLKEARGDDMESVIESYQRAHRCLPYRPEPPYYLARLFNRQKKYQLAYATLKGYLALPNKDTSRSLFVTSWAADWGIPFELSICASRLGLNFEALQASDCVAGSQAPEKILSQNVTNRKFFLDGLNTQRY